MALFRSSQWRAQSPTPEALALKWFIYIVASVLAVIVTVTVMLRLTGPGKHSEDPRAPVGPVNPLVDDNPP